MIYRFKVSPPSDSPSQLSCGEKFFLFSPVTFLKQCSKGLDRSYQFPHPKVQFVRGAESIGTAEPVVVGRGTTRYYNTTGWGNSVALRRLKWLAGP